MASGLRTKFLGDPALEAMGLLPGSAVATDGAKVWRTAWLTLIVGFFVILGLFWDTAVQIVEIWSTSSTFNHGFLIPPICLYLVWIKRNLIAEHLPEPSWWGLGLIALGGFFWLLGKLGSVGLVTQFSMIIVMQGLMLTVLGWRLSKLLIFPAFYMYFAVPSGEFLIAPLQDLTAVFVVEALRVVEIPVFLDGLFIAIPTGNFEVAEACSGVRFLIATLALGFLFAHLTYQSLWRRGLFILLAAIVPIVANGFRAFGIVIIAYYTNNEFAVGVDHIVYGWLFFAFVTIVLLFLGMAFREDIDDPEYNEARVAASRAGMLPAAQFQAAAVAVALAAAAPAYNLYLENRDVPRLSSPVPAHEVAGWQVDRAAKLRWQPHFAATDGKFSARYRKGPAAVDAHIFYFASQRGGGEVVSVRNVLADGKRWNRASTNLQSVDLWGDEIQITRHRLFGVGERRVVYVWYWTAGRFTSNPYLAKLLQVREDLFGGTEAAAAIVLSAAYNELPREADRQILDWIKDAKPLKPVLEGLAQSK